MKNIPSIILIALQGWALGTTSVAGPADSAEKDRKLEALKMIWNDGEAAPPGSDARQRLREEYLARTGVFIAAYSGPPDIWLSRAKAALELHRTREGWEAGRKLLALGLGSSPDREVQGVLVRLERMDWLGDRPPANASGSSRPGVYLTAAPPAPANQAGHPVLIADLGISLPWMPAGIFRMGPDENDNGKVQVVHVTRGFWLGATMVTQAQWHAMTGNNPSYFKDEGGDAPVEQVSWQDAADFCRRLDQRERAHHRVPPGYEYRLPTEAEWEYACRAGSTGEDGGDISLDKTAWYRDNSGGRTHPVGQKQPNAWGLEDMHGNLWEWCLDWYGPYVGGDVYDPAGSETGANRVNRGGSWFSVAPFLRHSLRYFHDPIDASNFCGFRLALAPRAGP